MFADRSEYFGGTDPPADATIVDNLPLYRDDGKVPGAGIPIASYGLLKLEWAGDRQFWCVSNAKTAAAFAQALGGFCPQRLEPNALHGERMYAEASAEHQLFYSELSSDSLDRMRAVNEACKTLKASTQVWEIEQSREASFGGNAMSLALTKRRLLSLDATLPSNVKTNLEPPVLRVGELLLSFFPYEIVAWNGSELRSIPYECFRVSASSMRFLAEVGLPQDATVIDALPCYSSGSTKPQSGIPIVSHGLLKVDCEGQTRRWCVSNQSAADRFAIVLGTIGAVSPKQKAAPTNRLYAEATENQKLFYLNITSRDLGRVSYFERAVRALGESEYVWVQKGGSPITDWKKNGGAGTSIDRKQISPVQVCDSTPRIKTNVSLVGFSAGDYSVWFLPDRVLLMRDDNHKNVGLSAVSVETSSCRFHEPDCHPQDAQRVGRTWNVINRDGSRDRRFNDNYEIPIYKYGEAIVTFGNFQLHIMTSKAGAAEVFAENLRLALGSKGTESGDQRNKPDDKPKIAPKLVRAYQLLGVSVGASMEQVQAAYRALARQTHPDLIMQMNPELRQFAEEQMRNLNVAVELIMNSRN
jgi:hypothetical protein